MFGPQILSIDLKVSEQAFENSIQQAASSNLPLMKVSTKEMQMRLSGKKMLKIDVDNNSESATFSFVAERDITNGQLIFAPIKLKNMKDAFFFSRYEDISILGTEEDPGAFSLSFLAHQCISHNGTIAYISLSTDHYEGAIIRDGVSRSINNFALVDSDSNLYTTSNAKLLPGDIDDIGSSFAIQTPINFWLQQNPEVQNACSKLQSIGEKMNYIGKYLIQARLNDEIDQEEFMDIFRQAGILGFTNPSVQRIYKLLI